MKLTPQDTSPPVALLEHVGQQFGATIALRDISLAIPARRMVGLIGPDGVGKSSLLNRACPQLQLPVGEVSEKLGRGRHTTRHIELYSLGNNTFVADTPGFSAFDTERMELVHKEQLQYAFPEFAPYLGHCQFPDCAHRKEPGCAVRKALADGRIGQTRYDSYCAMYDEVKDVCLLYTSDAADD